MKKVLWLMIISLLFSNVYALELDSKNALLYNLNDNQVLIEKNKDEKIYMSNLDRIMVTLIAIDQIDNLNHDITITYSMIKNSNVDNIGFEEGDIVTYNDLLYATLLTDAEDAKNALVISLAKSEIKFSDWMNDKAEKMELSNTHYDLSNIEKNYTSIEDTYKVLKEALKNSKFKTIFETNKYTLSTGKTIQSNITNYVSKYPDISKITLGRLSEKGNSLITTALDTENNIKYMLINLGTVDDMLNDTVSTYDYYFKNYKYHILIGKDEIVKTIDTKYSKEKIEVTLGEDIKYYADNIDKSLLKINYEGMETVKAGTEIGTVLGTVHVTYNDEKILDYDVILNKEIPFSLFKYIMSHIVIIIIGLIAIVSIIFGVRKKYIGDL